MSRLRSRVRAMSTEQFTSVNHLEASVSLCQQKSFLQVQQGCHQYEWKRRSGIHQHSIQLTVHSLTHARTTSLFQSYHGPRNTKMRGSCWCSSCVGRQQSLTCHLHLCTWPSQSWHSAARLSPLCKHYCCLKNAGRGVSPLSLNQKKTQLNPGKSSVVLSKH